MKTRRLFKIYPFLFACCLLLPSVYLTGCIDLATTKSLSKNKNYIFYSKAQIFVMRGGLGGIFSKGMNRLQRALEQVYRVKAESTVWYKAYDLSHYIIKNYGTDALPGPIVLAGHSLGANEQIKVAKNLFKAHIPVALLITVDAVSPQKVPPNVKRVINIYKPSHVPVFSGLEVHAMDPTQTQVENINVMKLKNMAVNHFTIDKDEKIQRIMIDNILIAINYKNKKHQ